MTSVSVEQNTQTASDLSLPESPSIEKGTYGQILKSSALVGGSSVLNIVIGIVRTKVMALLLGPAGFGLLSVYGSIVTLTQTFAGMGVNSSGVRQIAEAAGSNELGHIARITFILRRISLLLGILGALFLVVFYLLALCRCALYPHLCRAGSIDSGDAAHRRPRQNGNARGISRHALQHPSGVPFP